MWIAAEPDKAVVVDVLDLERNFIRVTLDHDLRRAARVEDGDRIAVGVGLELVGEGLEVIEPNALAAMLLAGGGRGVEKLGEELERFGAHDRSQLTEHSRRGETRLARELSARLAPIMHMRPRMAKLSIRRLDCLVLGGHSSPVRNS
jgi:hypothetical protein